MSIGQWPGVVHWIGQPMCYWVLAENGQLVACSTVD